ncbi:hypothetical protein PSTG_15590 [Puccinia striiformis f. sp. tritici PST-78]|uniref:Uncharacterized protein n=1 Tax=Puccinia striiformis f. sp. tritici PST-78 TaxID=1165861 RepID=A0A0L0UVC7_9BASI|nr:hypothetical protein PSTG_15590 [Puccinia striiformis f. sp. tritici PST-78]
MAEALQSNTPSMGMITISDTTLLMASIHLTLRLSSQYLHRKDQKRNILQSYKRPTEKISNVPLVFCKRDKDEEREGAVIGGVWGWILEWAKGVGYPSAGLLVLFVENRRFEERVYRS